MKCFCIIILFMALISCKTKEKEYIKNNEFVESNVTEVKNNTEEVSLINNSNEKLVDIEFDVNEIKLARFNDDDMKQNVIVIYRSESDAIENIDEIEPNQEVIEILEKPFEQLELNIFSEYSKKRLYNEINELFNIFGINLSPDKIEEFNSIRDYKNIKVKIENISIYLHKEFNEYKLFFVEYDNDLSFVPKIKTIFDKSDVINLLGNPSRYSDDRNIFIYNSNKSLRQINIYFNNENIKLVQLISWGGI